MINVTIVVTNGSFHSRDAAQFQAENEKEAVIELLKRKIYLLRLNHWIESIKFGEKFISEHELFGMAKNMEITEIEA